MHALLLMCGGLQLGVLLQLQLLVVVPLLPVVKVLHVMVLMSEELAV
jgi:hypothetical protein